MIVTEDRACAAIQHVGDREYQLRGSPVPVIVDLIIPPAHVTRGRAGGRTPAHRRAGHERRRKGCRDRATTDQAGRA